MKERPSVWFDFLLLLVTVHFLSDLFVKSLISAQQFAFFALALVLMIGLRVPLIHNWLRTGLCIAAIVIFFGKVYIIDGPFVFTQFLVLFLILLALYIMARFFGRRFGFG